MSETTRINLRIENSLLKRVREAAEARDISFNEYIASLCRKALAEADTEEPVQSTHPPARMTISLSEEERDRIQARATQENCTPKELFIRLLDQTCHARITIAGIDMMKFEEIIDPFISTIYGVAKVILRTEKAFPADLKKLLECTDKIYAAFAKIIYLETDLRNELYEEARKKYFPEIESTKQIRKRLKGKDKHGSNQD